MHTGTATFGGFLQWFTPETLRLSFTTQEPFKDTNEPLNCSQTREVTVERSKKAPWKEEEEYKKPQFKSFTLFATISGCLEVNYERGSERGR